MGAVPLTSLGEGRPSYCIDLPEILALYSFKRLGGSTFLRSSRDKKI